MSQSKYRLHRSSGQACVRLAGQNYYLGVHGSESSKREYERLLADHAAGRPLVSKRERQRRRKSSLVVSSDAAKVPQLRHHRSNGQGYVTLAGKRVYCGVWGSAECKAKYQRLLAEFLASGGVAAGQPKDSEVTIANLSLRYLTYAKGYYGEGPSSEFVRMRPLIKDLLALYRDCLVSEFGPLAFEAVRARLSEPYEVELNGPKKGSKRKETRVRSRRYVNTQMKRLRRMFKWGVSKQLVSPSVYQALQCVEPLKAGRCELVEHEAVKPVDAAVVNQTLPHLTRVVAAMVSLQLACGCRSGELVRITPSMVDRSGDVWVIKLAEHKTAYKGHERLIYLSTKAQTILAPFLLRAPNATCFSPRESMAEFRAKRRAERVTADSCGNRPGTNVKRKPARLPGEQYTPGSYAQAILRVCKAHGIPPWHPHQLRHSFATEMRRLVGIDATSCLLGHSDVAVTQVYAEVDKQKAVDAIRRLA